MALINKHSLNFIQGVRLISINDNDVKLFESQRRSDEQDGGGRATGNKVVDGNVNNLFLSISRIDCMIGDMPLNSSGCQSR